MWRRSRSASAGRSPRWTDRVGTVWKLAWLPLGGYVKLHGQERPEDVSPEVRARWISRPDLPRESRWLARAIVVAAGPTANFVLAVVLFAGAVRDRRAGRWRCPVVGEVLPDSAAAACRPACGRPDRRDRRAADPRFEDIQRIVVGPPRRSTLTMRVARGGADARPCR